MRQIFEKDTHMGHGFLAHQLFVHIRLKSQLLHVFVLANFHKALAPLVVLVPEILQDAQHPKHFAVQAHELLAGLLQQGRVVVDDGLVHRMRGDAATEHGVVNAFARCGCHHASGITGEHHIAAVFPARQGLKRNRRTFAAQGFQVRQATQLAQAPNGRAERIALVGAARANAHGVAVREDPAVKIRRKQAVVVHVAAVRVVAGVALRGLDDLVVCEHVFGFLVALDGLARHFGLGTISPDHVAGAHADRRVVFVFASGRVMHPGHAVGVFGDLVKHSPYAPRAVGLRPRAQPLIEFVTVDHAHKAVFNRNIHFFVRGRNHARTTRFGHQQVIRDMEVFDQARRNRAAAGLGAALPVQQQHRAALLRQVIGSGCSGGATADNDDVIFLGLHSVAPCQR